MVGYVSFLEGLGQMISGSPSNRMFYYLPCPRQSFRWNGAKNYCHNSAYGIRRKKITPKVSSKVTFLKRVYTYLWNLDFGQEHLDKQQDWMQATRKNATFFGNMLLWRGSSMLFPSQVNHLLPIVCSSSQKETLPNEPKTKLLVGVSLCKCRFKATVWRLLTHLPIFERVKMHSTFLANLSEYQHPVPCVKFLEKSSPNTCHNGIEWCKYIIIVCLRIHVRIYSIDSGLASPFMAHVHVIL